MHFKFRYPTSRYFILFVLLFPLQRKQNSGHWILTKRISLKYYQYVIWLLSKIRCTNFCLCSKCNFSPLSVHVHKTSTHACDLYMYMAKTLCYVHCMLWIPKTKIQTNIQKREREQKKCTKLAYHVAWYWSIEL